MSTIQRNPSNNAIIAAVKMIAQDYDKLSVPYALEDAVEKAVIDYVPVDGLSNHYNLVPKMNDQLIESFFDAAINKNESCTLSFLLLGHVNWLRIEHGRPPLEKRHPSIGNNSHWSTFDMDK